VDDTIKTFRHQYIFLYISICDADYMSRHPLINKEENNEELDGVCVVMTRSKTKQQITKDSPSNTSPSTTASSFVYSNQLSPLDPRRLKKEQHGDPEIQQIINEMNGNSNDCYSMHNGILKRKLQNGKYVPMIPLVLRKEILRSFHDHPTAGHFGRDKTWYRIKD